MNPSIANARRRLGDVRLLAFLRWSLTSMEGPFGITACSLVNQELDAGATLAELFITNEDSGFCLEVRRLRPNTFRIDFGCMAGPLAGDGATWEIVFTPEKTVESGTQTDAWVS